MSETEGGAGGADDAPAPRLPLRRAGPVPPPGQRGGAGGGKEKEGGGARQEPREPRLLLRRPGLVQLPDQAGVVVAQLGCGLRVEALPHHPQGTAAGQGGEVDPALPHGEA